MSEKIKFGKAIPNKITITPTSNLGFIVKVGCSTTCFNDSMMLIEALEEYIETPKETERRYNNSNSNMIEAIEGPPDSGSYEPRRRPTLSRDNDNCQDECQPESAS